MGISRLITRWCNRLRTFERRGPRMLQDEFDARELELWRKREIRRAWREACEGELGQWISTPCGGTVVIPRIEVIRCTGGEPTAMTVRLPAGRLPGDIEVAAPRLAYALGVGGLRVTPIAPMYVRVELLTRAEPNAEHPTPTLSFAAAASRSLNRSQPTQASNNRAA